MGEVCGWGVILEAIYRRLKRAVCTVNSLMRPLGALALPDESGVGVDRNSGWAPAYRTRIRSGGRRRSDESVRWRVR
ncbi:unnamed protein product [Hydatigera taeniaeformis]|uniref:Transposase n=1 Tax=Hydatigena taeniaeformis TaxID=6205 RepID=A0A0R3WLY7_HYDTA|nr:unnamed protein product [Hydatigera taeniaeformis]